MRKFAAAAALILLAGTITACGGQKTQESTAAETTAAVEAAEETNEAAAEETAAGYETYKSGDGWSVRYNPELIRVNEAEDEVEFVYTGECAGSCLTAVSVVPDAQPQEVLGRQTQELSAEEMENLVREEGYFAGDHWAFFEMTPASEAQGGDNVHEQWIAAEYNGGVLLVDTLVHYSGDDGKDMRMSDTLAEVLDSMEFENYEPQVMYEYVPGTYELTEDGQSAAAESGEEDIPASITLKEDHTGIVSGKEEIPVYWYSWKLVGETSDYEHEYTIEGDSLLLKIGDAWAEYAKK